MKEGDRIDYSVPPAAPSALVPEPVPLEVAYEDAWLLVVNKPAGLPVHPSPGHASGTLVHRLLAHCPNLPGIGGTVRPGIVHRLDMDTSGLLVVAKTDQAHQQLAAQFKQHTVHRLYDALVIGKPAGNRGRIDLPLGRHPQNRLKRAVIARGKPAVTHWEKKSQFGPFAHLRVKLETGRTHQVRVHLSEAGWPVLGDPHYGGSRLNGLDLPAPVKAELAALTRQALHAAELGFAHPGSGKFLHFSSPWPEDMERAAAVLREAARLAAETSFQLAKKPRIGPRH